MLRSGGGIGRHVRLRRVCRKVCGFKSHLEHHDFEKNTNAQVVELVDTTVLEAVAARCKSSSLFLGTIKYNKVRISIRDIRTLTFMGPLDDALS